MRTQKFIWNTITTVFLQLVMVASGLIVPRVMLLAYGSEINGLVNSLSQFINYFNLLEAGLSSATIYALYKPLADHNTYEINRILSASRKFYIQTGLIFLVMVGGLAVLYPLYIQKNGFSNFEISLLVLVLGINGVLEFFTLAKYRTLLTADQKTYIISLTSIVQWTVYTVIIVLLTMLRYNIILTRAIALLAIFIRTFLLIIYCRRRYKYLDYSVPPNVEALSRRWSALYNQIVGMLQDGGPVIILTVVNKDLKLISIYTVYNVVIAGIRTVLDIFSSGLAASFGDVIAQKQTEILKRAYTEFETLYHFAIGIVYTLSLILIIPFVRIYTSGVTDTEYVQPTVAALFVLNAMFYNFKTPQGMMVVAAGMYRETRAQTTIQGVILLVFGSMLSYYYGLPGLLIGIILSNLYRTIYLTFFVPRYITHTRIWNTVKQYLIIVFGQSIVLYFFYQSYLLDGIDNYLAWSLAAIKIGVWTVAVFAILHALFNRKEWLGIWNRVKLLLLKR
ncbi:hypothetical protein ACTQ4E_12795 [Lawsonibacter sp. LCP25S3_G6]|uniref:hypothetical protein n=1 Tax=unclassified Lawsonibacter TaxID=2617946 RepID=UPI003F960D84